MLAATNWGELTAIGTLVLSVPILVGVAVVAFKIYRRVHVVHEAVVGRPEAPGREAIPSMVERFQAHDEKLSQLAYRQRRMNTRVLKVEKELYPNHGSSLRDAVDRIFAALVETQVPPSESEKPTS